MNKPISRFPCGDMGTQAGGGHNPDPTPGFWDAATGDKSIDARGPLRVTGRLGHGYALKTERDDIEFVENASGVFAGDEFPVIWNRGLETIGIGDPDVDYFTPIGFVLRAYVSFDRLPAAGDINYDSTAHEGGNFINFFDVNVGVSDTGELKLRPAAAWVPTGVTVGVDEFHLYEIFVEFKDASDDRTTRVSLRVDEEVIAETCIEFMTYTSYRAEMMRAVFHSYSAALVVDDVAIDAITAGGSEVGGHWIGPGECAIVRPVAAVSRPAESWVSGTDYSPENSPSGSTLSDWYTALAYEIPYRPFNPAGDEFPIGGYGPLFGIGYVMSNPGADQTDVDTSVRRGASGEVMYMTLGGPGFTPNFSRTFMYVERTRRLSNSDDTIASEKIICGLASKSGYAGFFNFGLHSAGDTAWITSTQHLDSDAEDTTLFIRREINLPNVGVNVFAAGSQVAIDTAPGPALTFCTPIVPTTDGPIICFV